MVDRKLEIIKHELGFIKNVLIKYYTNLLKQGTDTRFSYFYFIEAEELFGLLKN